jgi:DNA-binding phage protein
VANALRMLLPTQIITTPGSPSTLLTTVLQQGKTKYIVHLLHYVPRRIGASSVGIQKKRERREEERRRYFYVP